MFRKLILILPLAAIAAAIVVGAMHYQRWHSAPLPLQATHVISVPAGASLNGLAEQLASEGVVEHAWDVKLLARLRRDAGRIKAGEYLLEPGLTLAGLLDMLVAGRVRLHALTVVEGTTFEQLLEQLRAHAAVDNVVADEPPAAIAEMLALPGGHPEGWFLPETYHFPRGTSDLEFLRRAHEAMQRVVEAAWAERDPDLPIDSPYEMLVLASIIEKETAVESERNRIAGVFVRRLRRGMRLETDPTVIYGLGKSYDGDLRSADMRRDTPYNTYRRKGLPPTPIALPSRESVFAAVHPAPGDALFFVARGPGKEHVFSATYEEHLEAVQEYAMTRRPLDEDEPESQ